MAEGDKAEDRAAHEARLLRARLTLLASDALRAACRAADVAESAAILAGLPMAGVVGGAASTLDAAERASAHARGAAERLLASEAPPGA